MSETNKPGPYPMPVRSQQQAPALSLPDLPSSSGAWFGTRLTILKKDAAFLRAHGDKLAARTEQTTKAKGLVDARIELERAVARLAWLPEVLRHDYELGREDRRHEIQMLTLAHHTMESAARAQLAAALNQEEALRPQTPAAPAHAPSSQSLNVADVENIVNKMPDISPDTRERLAMLLKAKLQDKR